MPTYIPYKVSFYNTILNGLPVKFKTLDDLLETIEFLRAINVEDKDYSHLAITDNNIIFAIYDDGFKWSPVFAVSEDHNLSLPKIEYKFKCIDNGAEIVIECKKFSIFRTNDAPEGLLTVLDNFPSKTYLLIND